MLKEELKELLEKGEKVRIIDVREADEYKASGDRFVFEQKDEQGNVTGTITAENIPMGKVYTDANKGKISKSERIIAVCKAGERCRDVAKSMKDNKGYWFDYLEGGLDDWNA